MKTKLFPLRKVFLMLFLLSSISLSAQNTRGLYVNRFQNILGSLVNEDAVIQYAVDHNLNYLLLLGLGTIGIETNHDPAGLAAFIHRAHLKGIKIGCQGYTPVFFSSIVLYNNFPGRNQDERFDVCDLEYEYWTTTGRPGLCSTYSITPCDHAHVVANLISGAVSLLDQMRTIANNDCMSFEMYLGQKYDQTSTDDFSIWPAEMIYFANHVDTLLLTSYTQYPNDVYFRTGIYERLEDIAYDLVHVHTTRKVTIRPLFSDEGLTGCGVEFFGAYLRDHTLDDRYQAYNFEFQNETGNDIAGARINDQLLVDGFQWFKYTELQAQVYYGNTLLTGSDPLNVTICRGSALTASSGLSYLWSTGATTRSIVFNNPGNYTVNVTITNGLQSGAGPCHMDQWTSLDVNVNVSQDFAPASPAVSSISPICSGSTLNLNAGTVTNATSYNWVGPMGYTHSSLSPNTSISAVTTTMSGLYSLVAEDANGCFSPPASALALIGETPTVADPPDQTVCSGSSTADVIFSGTPSCFTTFTWTNGNTNIGLAASGTDNIGTFTATNTGNAPVTATIEVTPHYTEAFTTCDGIPQNFDITVNPIPDVDDPVDLFVCNNAIVPPIVFTGLVIGTTYTWTNSNTNIGLSLSSGNGNTPVFTAVNPLLTPVTATITVTPHFSNNSVTCDGNAQSFNITVNPTPDVVQPSNQVICAGITTAPVTFSGSVGGTTYSWTNSEPSIGLAPTGNGNIGSFVAVNTGTVQITATITVTPSANGCEGLSQSFTITVNPTPTIVQPPNQSFCNGENTVPIIFSGSIPGTTFSWMNNNTGIGLGSSGNGAINSFVAVNNGSVPITATITVTPSANGCAGPSVVFNITVNPLPTPPFITGGNTVCFGGSTPLFLSNGSTSYQWYMNGIIIPGATNGYYYAQYNNTPPLTDVYTVVSTNQYGCTALSSNTLSVTSDPDCCGNPVTELTQALINNNNTFSGDYVLLDNISILSGSKTFGNTFTLTISAGKKIYVANGGQLTLDGATLFPCNKMWKGIEVANQGSLINTHLTIKNNSKIIGAEYAVNIAGDANVDIQNSTFDNNYISVYFPSSPSGHNGTFIFEKNIITQTNGSTLPTIYPSQGTVPGIKPLAGMEIHDAAGIQIGNLGSVSSFNTFSNLNAGIFSFKSNLIVQNSKFLNIVEDPSYTSTGYYNGSGIYADGFGGNYFLNVYGFGQSSAINNFEGCKYGVFANIINVTVKDNIMDTYSGTVTMYTGCKAAYCDGKSISIVYNNMNCESNGVQLYYNYRTSTCEVIWNKILFGSNSSASSSAGISCYQSGTHENYTLISHNRIDYNQYGGDGIQVYTGNNMRIEYNEMYMTNNNNNLTGIRVVNSASIDISCNQVTGGLNVYNNTVQAGISILHSSCIIGCNAVDKTYDGIFFSQRCTPTSLFGNAFNNHHFGLHLDPQALIGTQLYQGNLWIGTCTLEAYNENTTVSYFSAGEYFVVNNSIGGSVDALPFPRSPAVINNTAISWFFTGTKANFYCSNPLAYYCKWYIQQRSDDPIESTNPEVSSDGNSYFYPNPTSLDATLVYSIPEQSTGTLQIFNTIGEMVLQQSLTGALHQTEISLTDIKQGIYFYKISVNNEMISAGKISIIR
jgi:hypothetical protein